MLYICFHSILPHAAGASIAGSTAVIKVLYNNSYNVHKNDDELVEMAIAKSETADSYSDEINNNNFEDLI